MSVCESSEHVTVKGNPQQANTAIRTTAHPRTSSSDQLKEGIKEKQRDVSGMWFRAATPTEQEKECEGDD